MLSRITLLSRASQIAHLMGPRWVLYRACHAAKIKSGWFRFWLPNKRWDSSGNAELVWPDFLGRPGGSLTAVVAADAILSGQGLWFSRHQAKAGFPPHWFHNPFGRNGDRQFDKLHWSEISDFGAGDIKGLWEMARFGWVFPLMRAYAFTQDGRYAEAFWLALEDWRDKNPPQCGPHWKCGQEIALRALAWIVGAAAFRDDAASNVQRRGMLAEMLSVSGERIAATIGYALSQSNNHGVSEATGLFVIGQLTGKTDWEVQGRRLLGRLAVELIYEDGSFSQHSTNYHRLALHSYLMAIRFAQWSGKPLSDVLVHRVAQAGRWLQALLVPHTGQVPNLGANDGAHLFDLTDLGYRDFRPAVQAVAWATERQPWLSAGPWDELAMWLGFMPSQTQNQVSCADPPALEEGMRRFSDGGYTIWRSKDTLALLRCPSRFRHRPSHADLLHLDLWHVGRNVLCDGGSYSYNCDQPWQDYFASVAAHNTIQFDEHDQMPKLSRFLYGQWPVLKTRCLGENGFEAEYNDWMGCAHCRQVRFQTGFLEVEDTVSGFSKQAVLRWRLGSQLHWNNVHNGFRSAIATITVNASSPAKVELTKGWESLYYWEKTPLPVMEVRIQATSRPITIKTRIDLVA